MSWQISASTETILRLNAELIGFFYNRVKQRADAEELASTTWVAAGKNFQHLSSLRHFVFAVAHKVLAQHRRVIARWSSTEAMDCEELPAAWRTLDSLLFQAQRNADIERCVAQLPDPYREVVQLALTGHNSKEIAAILRLNRNTVRSRLSRGTEALRLLLKTQI